MTTDEKIEYIMNEYVENVFNSAYKKIMRAELEALVLVAKLEMLNEKKLNNYEKRE